MEPRCARKIRRTVTEPRRTRQSRLGRRALWLSLAACAPEASPDEGGFIALLLEDTTRTPCIGTVPHLDRYVERVFEFLDVPIPNDFDGRIEISQDVPCQGGACYLPWERAIYANSLDDAFRRPSGTLRHELSHAVIDRAWGWSVPFFDEGFAEAMTPNLTWPDSDFENKPIGDMLDQDAIDVDYTAAARFIRYLVHTRGIEPFHELFMSIEERTQSSIRARFAEVYGEDFADVEAEYLERARPCTFQLDICDAKAAEPVDDRWEAFVPVACEDPDVFGSAGPDGPIIEAQRTLDVRTAGTYRLRSSSDVVISRCGDCDTQWIRRLYAADDLLDLEVGLYTLEFSRADDDLVFVELIREGP
jgi:hypothetical protein